MYTWDLEELKRRKCELENLRLTKKKKLNEDKLSKIMYSIKNYDLLLCLFDSEEDVFLEEDITDKDLVNKYFIRLYKSINPDIVYSVVNSCNVFESSCIPDTYTDNTKSKIELLDIISITKDIFASFNDIELMKKVNEILDPNNHLLHFSNTSEFNSLDADYTGFSCRDYYRNIGYAIIYRNNKIRDLYTLVHEVFHLVIKEHLPVLNTDDRYFIDEVEGSFADLVVTDYLISNNLFKEDALEVERSNFNTTKYFTRGIYVANNFNQTFNGDYFDMDFINDSIPFNYSLDDDIMRSSILSFDRDLCYSFSYLVALDLFYKYKNGYQDVIGDLKGLSDSKRPFIMMDRYNISFNKDGYKNLKDYQKVLSLRKKDKV